MRQHGIWTSVNSDANYAKPKDFGACNRWSADVAVGTSSSNSNHLGTIAVTRQHTMDGWVCCMYVDSKLIKTQRYSNKWVLIEEVTE